MSGDAGVQGGPAKIRGRGGICCVIAVWCEPFLWGWQSFVRPPKLLEVLFVRVVVM